MDWCINLVIILHNFLLQFLHLIHLAVFSSILQSTATNIRWSKILECILQDHHVFLVPEDVRQAFVAIPASLLQKTQAFDLTR